MMVTDDIMLYDGMMFIGAQPAASYKPKPSPLSSVADTREFKTEAGDHYQRFDGHPVVQRAKAPQARAIETGPFQGRSVTKEDFNGILSLTLSPTILYLLSSPAPYDDMICPLYICVCYNG